MNKKKIGIVIGIIVLVLVIILGSYFLFFQKEEETKEESVNHKTAEKLYKEQGGEACTEVVTIEHHEGVDATNDKVLLYLIFGQMKKDGALKDKISVDTYYESAKKVLKNEDIPTGFNNYIYEGYEYQLKDSELTRKKATCDSKRYVSKMYGYSSNENTLTLNIKAGYVENNKVYDLTGKELGTYDKEKLNEMLDKGTLQVYEYQKVNGNYQLSSVGAK